MRSSSSSARLLAALAVGVLALVSTSGPERTGALYTGTATVTVDGFQVQPLCAFESYSSPGALLASLGPVLHWGFAPGESPWPAASGAPEAVEPDGTLLCDDGVLPLAEGVSVATGLGLEAPGSLVLVLGEPAADGAIVSLPFAGGAAELAVADGQVVLRSWPEDEPAVQLAAAPLTSGGAHVVALVLTAGEALLWVDGSEATTTVTQPVTELGLGAGPGSTLETATVSVSELAVLGSALDPGQLALLASAAVAG